MDITGQIIEYIKQGGEISENILYYAVINDLEYVVNKYIEKNIVSSITIAQLINKGCNVKMLEILLDNNRNHEEIMILAIKYGLREAIKRLLRNGVKVTDNIMGEAVAYHYYNGMILCPDINIIKVLLSKGGKVTRSLIRKAKRNNIVYTETGIVKFLRTRLR